MQNKPLHFLCKVSFRENIILNFQDNSKPYIAILVLVCGVVGGLIIVISIIFFCKFCFKKRQPLTG